MKRRIITFYITPDNDARLEAECHRYEALEGCKCAPARVLNLLMAQHLPSVPASVVEIDTVPAVNGACKTEA